MKKTKKKNLLKNIEIQSFFGNDDFNELSLQGANLKKTQESDYVLSKMTTINTYNVSPIPSNASNYLCFSNSKAWHYNIAPYDEDWDFCCLAGPNPISQSYSYAQCYLGSSHWAPFSYVTQFLPLPPVGSNITGIPDPSIGPKPSVPLSYYNKSAYCKDTNVITDYYNDDGILSYDFTDELLGWLEGWEEGPEYYDPRHDDEPTDTYLH